MLNKVFLNNISMHFNRILTKLNVYMHLILSYKYRTLDEFLEADIDISTMIFNENKSLIILDIEKKFNKFIECDSKNPEEFWYSPIQQVLYLYSIEYISLEHTKKLLNYLFKFGYTLLPYKWCVGAYEKRLKVLYPSKYKPQENLIKNVDNKLLTFMINNDYVGYNEKEFLDYLILNKVIEEIQIIKYHVNVTDIICYVSKTIEDIITRGYIFKTKNVTYNSLKILFGVDELNKFINNRSLLICYQNFMGLSLIGKKVLTSQLVKDKKEDCIFNLLLYGLNLNWSIKTDTGKENIVGLEVLYSVHLIKMLFASEVFNVCISNTRGENILHLLGSLPLMDTTIKHLLDDRISKLTLMERECLFNQVNDNNMTPLFQAIYAQDELMIDYILSWGVKVDDSLLGLSHDMNSALSFLDNTLLPVARLEKKISWMKVDESAYIFWQKLSKEWNASKLYDSLNKTLMNKEILAKSVKL